jgi:hypothetical protein
MKPGTLKRVILLAMLIAYASAAWFGKDKLKKVVEKDGPDMVYD